MNYKPVIGLEIHIKLRTKSKMFCQCSADFFGKEPNTQVCPVCLGLPGALPLPNKLAVEWTIKIAKALNCKINKKSKFDRKHYSYPDLPKGYQISQYDEPIGVYGFLKLETQIDKKTFRIRRVHLEEDTGKLSHLNNETLIDFNRSGVPLVEIVTEPDFGSSSDVKVFLEELTVLIRYLEVADCDMEKGTMRLEPNISMAKIPTSNDQLPNYKVEVKNINSFRFVKQAVDFELKRQSKLLEDGETPKQETRGYDEKKGVTYSQRSKEEAHDYRYFEEPDIPPMVFTDNYIATIQVPELPGEKVSRFVRLFGLKKETAIRLTRDINVARLFEQLMLDLMISKEPEKVANLIINKKIDLSCSLKELTEKVREILLPIETDMKLLESTIIQVIKLNSKVVDDYKKGKTNAIMFLVGKVMGEMRGKADPKLIIHNLKSQIQKFNI